LQHLGIAESVPAQLPDALWTMLEQVALGEAIEWRPRNNPGTLGCTRYEASRGGFLLLMREVSDKQAALVQTLNRERFASTSRLIASVAHDVRSSVASIVYGADFLEERATSMAVDTLHETVRDICDATRRMSLTVDALLDYARLGPAIAVPVSLREVLSRAQGLLRSSFCDGAHRLRVVLASQADWVRGNPVIVEQILVNVLLSAVECADGPGLVTVTSERLSDATVGPPGQWVLVRVCIDGANSAERALSHLASSPIARGQGVSLALTDARDAIEGYGGSFDCERTHTGACFVLSLPRSEGPR
jgi:signal transduction histidine kinase